MCQHFHVSIFSEVDFENTNKNRISLLVKTCLDSEDNETQGVVTTLL